MTNKNYNMVLMLEYSIKRYQQMGNGTKCQDLLRQLNAVKKNDCTANA